MDVLCAPHKAAVTSSGVDDENALVVVAETNSTDAYCSAKECELVQERLLEAVRDSRDDDSDDSDDRRILTSLTQWQKCGVFGGL